MENWFTNKKFGHDFIISGGGQLQANNKSSKFEFNMSMFLNLFFQTWFWAQITFYRNHVFWKTFCGISGMKRASHLYVFSCDGQDHAL